METMLIIKSIILNHYALKDSISSVQKLKSLAYYQTLYETEKRDHEIENQKASIDVLNLKNRNKNQLLLFGSLGLLSAIWWCYSVSFFFNHRSEDS